MAGVEVEKTVPNTEEKTMTEMPKETVHTTTDDSVTAVEVEIKEDEEVPKVEKETETTETAPVKDKKPVEIPAAAEEKDVKPAAEEEKTVEVKTA
ncbi:plasma membrane-associated cation-binding protein 2 [Raphanus sativus]|uniref:Plasma membrane-associated cation-binding protein 2 n=1 Tax=Raphanus sativus TaxID=3726 RepID=A0A6J0M8V6_RAPSA|nr:plasma membrane-associated cation-binding protein 2 [Raphanus sativus]